MLSLLLTILSSLTVSLILTLNERHNGDRGVLSGSNYVIATLLAGGLGGFSHSIPTDWIALSALIGIGFVAGFTLLMRGIRLVGLAVTVSIARIATLGPVLLSIVFYDEKPATQTVVGILLGLSAFILLGFSHNDENAKRRLTLSIFLLLGLLFLVMTGNDFAMKAAQIHSIDKEGLLFVVFGASAIMSWGMVLLTSRRSHSQPVTIRTRDLLLGAALGIPNFFSSWFLLRALADLPASFVFPIVSLSGVLLSSLVAILFFKERPTAIAWVGILVAAVAVVLLGGG